MVEHITLGVKYKTNTGQIIEATGGTVLNEQTELLNYKGAPRIMLVECVVDHGDGISEYTYVLNTQLEEVKESEMEETVKEPTAIKTEVFTILDARIDLLERKVEWFEKFGNSSKPKEVLEHVNTLERLSELNNLKSDLEYNVRW